MTKYQSPALDKGLDILEYLSLKAVPQSKSEIAFGLERKPNEIYRMLVTLEDRGYINKEEVSNKYSLSLKLYHLSHRHPPINTIRMAALSPMQGLSDFSKQSCHLSILYKNQLLVIAQCSSAAPISLSVEDGSLFSIYKTTSGRVILSKFKEKEQLGHLNKVPSFKKLSTADKNKYLKEVDTVAQQGFAVQESEIKSGVIDVVVPFYVPEIEINGALAVSILSGRSDVDIDTKVLVEKAIETVESILNELGIST